MFEGSEDQQGTMSRRKSWFILSYSYETGWINEEWLIDLMNGGVWVLGFCWLVD